MWIDHHSDNFQAKDIIIFFFLFQWTHSELNAQEEQNAIMQVFIPPYMLIRTDKPIATAFVGIMYLGDKKGQYFTII